MIMNKYKGMSDVFDNLSKDVEVLMFQGKVVEYVNVWDEPYERLTFKYGDSFFDTKQITNETQEAILDYLNENLEIFTYDRDVKL